MGKKKQNKSRFETFMHRNKVEDPITTRFYLLEKDLKDGMSAITLVDVSDSEDGKWQKKTIKVSEKTKKKIKSNILYARIIDIEPIVERIGLEIIENDFEANGIISCPDSILVQIFLTPSITERRQKILANYFNLVLEYWRKKCKNSFLIECDKTNDGKKMYRITLEQIRSLIETFPLRRGDESYLEKVERAISSCDIERMICLIKTYPRKPKIQNTIDKWFI